MTPLPLIIVSSVAASPEISTANSGWSPVWVMVKNSLLLSLDQTGVEKPGEPPRSALVTLER